MKCKFLIPLFLSFILVGCTGNNPGEKDIGPTQSGDKGAPITRETLHEGVYDITNSNNVFYDGEIKYRIVTKENETNTFITKTLGMMTTQIKSAVNDSIEIVYDDKIDVNDFNIVFNRDDLLTSCGVSISPKLSNAKVGYQITSVGNSVFIYGSNSEAMRLAVIRFLSFTIGYDCLGENIFIFERDGKLVNSSSVLMMPDFHIVEKPDYEARMFTNWAYEEEDFYMGFSDTKRNELCTLGTFHNGLSDIYPLSIYKNTHPNFYDSSKQQICYTAHGNQSEYKLMIDIAAKTIADHVMKPQYENLEYVFFCHQDVTADGHNWCNCSACREKIKKLSPNNGANVATYIPYMNDVVEAFDKEISSRCQQQGIPKRNVTIGCLVYHQSQSLTAPDEPIPELIFDDRLLVCVAPIQFKYEKNFDDIVNSYVYKQVERWKLFSNNIGTWSYNINFSDYLCPYNTFDTMIDYYRLFFNNGSNFMLNEGYWGMEHTSHFTAFKDYIDSKCLIDLSVNYQDLEDRFFKYYYGDAGVYMKQMYKEIVQNCVYAMENNIADGGIKCDNKSYYTFSTLLRFADYMDQAYDAIEPLRLSDNELYSHYKLNLQVEGVFPHYVLACHKDDYLSNDLRIKFRQMLYDEATATNIDDVYENGKSLKINYFSKWGF